MTYIHTIALKQMKLLKKDESIYLIYIYISWKH